MKRRTTKPARQLVPKAPPLKAPEKASPIAMMKPGKSGNRPDQPNRQMKRHNVEVARREGVVHYEDDTLGPHKRPFDSTKTTPRKHERMMRRRKNLPVA